MPGTRPNTSAKLSTQTTHIMREEFVEIWKQAKADSPKLEFYHKIKTEFGPGPEQYLTSVRNPEARKSLTRLRISAHNLFVERGRYENPLIPRDKQTCVYCSANLGSKKIEDELHVLVKCPLYSPLKKKFNFYLCSEVDL